MLILFNKPFRVLCQFTDPDKRSTLADFVPITQVYPAGRLDFDSEGLLLLTNNGRLQAHISQPRSKIRKRYWAQVEGTPSDEQLQQLVSGITLKDGAARAVSATQIEPPQGVWQREPPIRERKSVADNWLDIALSEGRNRQVRRMSAAVGLPILRLIRHAIGPWTLDGLAPGEYRQISAEDAWSALRQNQATKN